MTYDSRRQPGTGHLIADEAVAGAWRTRQGAQYSEPEAGNTAPQVPMRYMNSDKHFKVVSISAFCTVHDFADSRKLGEAILKAIDNTMAPSAVLAERGSLSHRFIDDQRAEEGMNSHTREFDHQMDERVVKLWREGNSKSSAPCCRSTPTTATAKATCTRHGDAARPAGLGINTTARVEFITELFASSGTGQVNAVFRCRRRRKRPHAAAFYRRRGSDNIREQAEFTGAVR
ncbi:hypothetical protein LNP74_17290 [Klebsiella pneumoniae subsp. pneumoniae]|nr:hypothetical protein [Klebsiella pneumoniae subsp. pneumoniae]